jgi:hypothetical protein
MTGHNTGQLSKEAKEIRQQYKDFVWLVKG